MSVETKELKYHSVGHAIVSSYYRGEEYVISEMNTIIAIMDGVKKYQKGEKRAEAYKRYNDLRNKIHEKKYHCKLSETQLAIKATGGSLYGVLKTIRDRGPKYIKNEIQMVVQTPIVVSDSIKIPAKITINLVSDDLKIAAISKIFEKDQGIIHKLDANTLMLIAGIK